jgi:hypothetical protein
MAMGMANFDVIVWVKKTESFHALRNELLGLAKDEPDESTGYEGMVDFHWGFVHLSEAERLATALSPLTSRPEVVLLRLSNYTNLDTLVTYKDARVPRH